MVADLPSPRSSTAVLALDDAPAAVALVDQGAIDCRWVVELVVEMPKLAAAVSS